MHNIPNNYLMIIRCPLQMYSLKASRLKQYGNNNSIMSIVHTTKHECYNKDNGSIVDRVMASTPPQWSNYALMHRSAPNNIIIIIIAIITAYVQDTLHALGPGARAPGHGIHHKYKLVHS